ncbi:TraR/DksA family transcriptional regulator [Microbispora amethystogenes]|uniref:TraR/DksA family transcriptional regulator n=2 Tax=Microbispora TaxID=2005 RepID=A0A5J5K2L5_9ACTN|nr:MULTISPECIES: TraR/DksA family transcriptional regulator [Microbispora]KAA9378469.1 TraR/DksA family transcriptional regulator [Microbispora cellulosiformans]GIH35381.1 molecular chaperone DnaK [Microbispora amethystogenes]
MTTSDEFTAISEPQTRLIRAELEEQLQWREVQLRDLRAEVDGGEQDTARLALLADVAATERAVTELRRTLERMEEGHYGRCADCAAAIPFGRLKIRPLARYCIACQRRHEAR